VRSYLVRCGGIRPASRRRSPGRLSLAEREEISRGLAAGLSLRTIAAGLGRAASTVSREVAEHGGRGGYRAARADQLAWSRARRPQACKLVTHRRLRAIVAEKLQQEQWSPQQIAGWLQTTYPDEAEMQVSHETIFRTLFIQSRGALRKELTAHLRTGRVIRRPAGTRLPDGRGGRPGILNISERQGDLDPRRGRVPRSLRGFNPIWMWPKADPPILIGGSGPRLLQMVAELGDGWLAIVTDRAEFEESIAALNRACQDVGRPMIEVTACLFEADERLLDACAEHGVRRCALLAPTHDRPAFESFLDRCTRLQHQF
jgi:hypothetical protein